MTIITWDTVNKGTGVILSNGNLTAKVPNASNTAKASVGKTSGKWYWEFKMDILVVSMVGIVNSSASLNSMNASTQNVRYYYTSGTKYPEAIAYGTSHATGDTIGIALDLDNGTLTFYKNGVSQGVSHTNVKSMGEVFPAISSGSSTDGNTVTANFGATPFKYPIPTGFKAYNNDIINKSFILLSDGYKKFNANSWQTVSPTLPTLNQFQTEGMDDLSIFDSKVQKVLESPKAMTSEVLGVGKVYKASVDLNKYFDLRKLEVK